MLQQDTFQHKGLRKKLVDEIRDKGITDEHVLDAILRVPRHFFMESGFLKFAYSDQAFPIGAGQTISQPYTVARQSELLQVKAGEKILEIGTGSGYQASVLAVLGAKVFTIERHRKLYEKTKPLLLNMGYTSVRCFFGDGFEGLPGLAPFNKILITAAVPELPKKLLAQLSVGGKMVLPFGEEDNCDMVRITKHGEGQYEEEVFEKFAFVPMLKGKVY